MLFHIATISKTLVAADVTLFRIINSHHTLFFDRFFWLISNLGNGWVMIPLLCIFIIWRTPKSIRLTILTSAALALSVSGLCNLAVKQLVSRPRPSEYFSFRGSDPAVEDGRLYGVHVVGERFTDHSFPSGHTNMAFTLATLLVVIFGRRYWPVFLVAAVVAYSRVYMGFHFPLDTLAGASMGSTIALAAWRGAERVDPIEHS